MFFDLFKIPEISASSEFANSVEMSNDSNEFYPSFEMTFVIYLSILVSSHIGEPGSNHFNSSFFICF